MRNRLSLAAVLGTMLVASAAVAGAESPAGRVQALVPIRSSAFDQVSVRPGVDFAGYTKVIIDPTQASINETWARFQNVPPLAVLRHMTPQDIEQIVSQTSAGFGATLARAINRAGYEIVSTPGPNVLRLSPNITDLSVNAPAAFTNPPATRVYTFSAGDATLGLELRDSVSGELLARVSDHRMVGQRGPARSNLLRTTTVNNRFDFGNLFDTWSSGWVETLAELKQQSPGTAASKPLS